MKLLCIVDRNRYADHFLKGNVTELACEAEFKAYRSCVRVRGYPICWPCSYSTANASNVLVASTERRKAWRNAVCRS